MTLNTAFHWYSPISTCTTNLECLPSPIPEIWKKTQNVKMSVIWGDLGHHRSSAISAFDRAHTSSYSFFIETMRLSCTVFEILSASCRKSQIFLPNVYLPPLSPPMGWPQWNFTMIFGVIKLESLSCGVIETDGQTDIGPWHIPR